MPSEFPNYAALDRQVSQAKPSQQREVAETADPCCCLCDRVLPVSSRIRKREKRRKIREIQRYSGNNNGGLLLPRQQRTRAQHGVGLALGAEAALPGLRRVAGRLQGQPRRLELIPLPGKLYIIIGTFDIRNG